MAGKLDTIQSKGVKSVLTNRQIEYLSLAALGYTNKEIANILFVELTTVKNTLSYIYNRLKAVDRTHAVTIAFLHDLLNPRILSLISNKLKVDIFRNKF